MAIIRAEQFQAKDLFSYLLQFIKKKKKSELLKIYLLFKISQ